MRNTRPDPPSPNPAAGRADPEDVFVPANGGLRRIRSVISQSRSLPSFQSTSMLRGNTDSSPGAGYPAPIVESPAQVGNQIGWVVGIRRLHKVVVIFLVGSMPVLWL